MPTRQIVDDNLLKSLYGTHDLKILPMWGPYGKRYMGVSHIPPINNGMRFDFSVMPGIHRRKIEVPNVKWDTGYYPIAASSQLEYYCHRHAISESGGSFCDVEFYNLDENEVAFRCNIVNNSGRSDNFSLNYFAWINFPQRENHNLAPVCPAKAILPGGCHWKDGTDHKVLSFGEPYFRQHLSQDCRPHGYFRDHGFVDGHGCCLGLHDGDSVEYEIEFSENISNACLLMRYKLPERRVTEVELSGMVTKRMRLNDNGAFALRQISLPKNLIGKHNLILTKKAGGNIQIDGFAVADKRSLDRVRFESVDWKPVPEIEHTGKNSVILRYNNLNAYYGIKWESQEDSAIFREYRCKELDIVVRKHLNNLVQLQFEDDGDGHFANVVFSPVFLAPNASKQFEGCVCCGDYKVVKRRLENFSSGKTDLIRICNKLKRKTLKIRCGKNGEKYLPSQQYLANLLLTQVVYPVNIARNMIRHAPPGRWWDCLYTWDSGFIGLGLADLDIERSIWNLNTYMTSPDERYAAFVDHGTPLPVQHYLFWEIWNRTRSEKLLEFFSPALRRYYLFLAGRYGSSNTRNLNSEIIRTWDYSYNSGGWDDYPPQDYVYRNKLKSDVTPVVSTAHLIRVAKILKMFALKTNQPYEDYDNDISIWTAALNKYSWDEDAGYFSYVVHNKRGNPRKILRHHTGANFNMGMDGVSPLVSGICTPEQQKILLSNIMTKGRMWSDVGISTVDQRAPYYSDSGYWNGSVWMPHQWFLWKTMLDLGENQFAYKIAHTALELWERETATTNSSFEYFSINSGRGSGWHHFTGLSCPVINWFAAYFKPGTFSGGFDLFVDDLKINTTKTELNASLINNAGRREKSVCVVVMNPKNAYKAILNGVPADIENRMPGVAEIKLPQGKIDLTIKPE